MTNNDIHRSPDTDQAMRIAMGVYAFVCCARLQSSQHDGTDTQPFHRDVTYKFAELNDDAVDGFSEMGRIMLTETNTGAYHGQGPVNTLGIAPQVNMYLPMIVGSVLFGLLAVTGLIINAQYIKAATVGVLFLLLMPLAGAIGSYRSSDHKDGGLLQHIGEHIVHAILSAIIGLLSSKLLWFIFVILMGIAFAAYMSIVELTDLGTAPSSALAPSAPTPIFPNGVPE